MIDRLGRNITYLRISVTDKCNLRCRYCMPEDGICKMDRIELMTEEEMIQAVEVAASLGIRKLRITGGEPLVKCNILSICQNSIKAKFFFYLGKKLLHCKASGLAHDIAKKKDTHQLRLPAMLHSSSIALSFSTAGRKASSPGS